MNDRLAKLLECDREFHKGISIYKEAFIQFYGEERRQEIEEKFQKAMFIGYQNPSDVSKILNKIEENKSQELVATILSDNKTPLTKEDLFSSYSFSDEKLLPITHCQKLYYLHQLGENGRLEQFIISGFQQIKPYLKNLTEEQYYEIFRTKKIPEKYQNIPQWLKNKFNYYLDEKNCQESYVSAFEKIQLMLQKIDPSIDSTNFDIKLNEFAFQSLNEILKKYQLVRKEYDSYLKQFFPYYQYCKNIDKLKDFLQNKYYQQLIRENLDLIPIHKQKGIEEFFNDSTNKYKLDPYIGFLFGFSLKGFCGLDCFTDEKDQELENGNVSSWLVEDTKELRIKYFKANGIDLGDCYENYLNNPEVMKIWPTKERIRQFFEIRNRLINEFNIEYFNSIGKNQEIRKQIDSLGLLDKDDSFNANLYEINWKLVNPNLIETKNGYDLKSLVIIGFSLFDIDDIDQIILHELNHLFELSFEEVGNNHYEILCGWDHLSGNFNQTTISELDTTKQDKNKREYELFSEIINELIAQDICKIMHENNMYVFGDPNDLRISHTTDYEHSLFLVKEFYEEFKDAIIKSRSNGNIQVIFEEVGKENFDELNSLFKIYYEYFGGSKILGLYESLEKGEDTPKTRIYYDLIQRKDAILDRMRNYKELSDSAVASM